MKYLEFTGKVPRMVLHVGSVKYPCIQVVEAGRTRQIMQTDNDQHYREMLKWPRVEPLTEITPAIAREAEAAADRAQKRAALIALEREMNAAQNRSKEALAAVKSANDRARRTAIEADNLAKSALDLAQEADKQAKIFDQKKAQLDALKAEMAPKAPEAPQDQPRPDDKAPPAAAPKKSAKNGKRAKKEAK